MLFVLSMQWSVWLGAGDIGFGDLFQTRDIPIWACAALSTLFLTVAWKMAAGWCMGLHFSGPVEGRRVYLHGESFSEELRGRILDDDEFTYILDLVISYLVW